MARLSQLILKLFGWSLHGQLPDEKKYVIIFYPHTSNWDFILGVLSCFVLKLDFTFLGKHSLFEGPFGWVFRRLGGFPVKRDERKNMVTQVVELIESRERIALALAPEGTSATRAATSKDSGGRRMHVLDEHRTIPAARGRVKRAQQLRHQPLRHEELRHPLGDHLVPEGVGVRSKSSGFCSP